MPIWIHWPHRSAVALGKVANEEASIVAFVASILESWGTLLGVVESRIRIDTTAHSNMKKYSKNLRRLGNH